MVLKGPSFWLCCVSWGSLTAESVEGTSLALQSVDNVHGGDGLSFCVLGVGDGVTDDVLKEDLQYTAGLLVDEARDTLDTTTAGKTTDGWLGDTLDVITQHLPVSLSASLSKTLSSFSTSRHVDSIKMNELWLPWPRPAYIVMPHAY